jgi:hypothetical protein
LLCIYLELFYFFLCHFSLLFILNTFPSILIKPYNSFISFICPISFHYYLY